ncbi:hypothetical protein RHGRI_011781 [Rhododendron griersonianum]|uniref:NPF family transporter n=1 Tax=Rhododendron griersonianum TaxID=479676 RepID=A0AAV6KNM8_9ERIC|nr:hypothetical protein RHGRI_011781 [Rhododendron griersonianum]
MERIIMLPCLDNFLLRLLGKQGLILLTMSRLIPNLWPCGSTSTCSEPRKIHEVIFFLAIYLISISTGGHKPSLESFGADQFDDNHSEERTKKMSFSNWWTFGLCSGLLLALTVVSFVQHHVSWVVADITLTIVMTSSLLVFCIGMPFYRYRMPTGSPLTPMIQVVVAAFSKRNLACPSNPSQLYEVPKSQKTEGRLLLHTDKLKTCLALFIKSKIRKNPYPLLEVISFMCYGFLDKAAIIDDGQDSTEKQQNPWRLTTVTQVEEMKLLLNMIPIWLTALPFGICVAQASTFFIKQGTTLDHKISRSFFIPPSSIYSVATRGMVSSVIIYDKIAPFLRAATRNERGFKILQRVGIGMVFSVVTMVAAALVERKRLTLVENDPIKGSSTMSVVWLAPQFLIIGVADGFALVGLQEFFYDQVPDSMRSTGIALYHCVMGAAYFVNCWLITIVDYATEKSGKSWFGKDLNSSRLDNFYWLLAVITAANIGVYVIVARRYTYKNVQERVL